MYRPLALLLIALSSLALLSLSNPVIADEFEPRDGERIVLLGSEFIEQQIKHNYFEETLIKRWPERKIQIRNLGWSGDTPSAIARGYFNGKEEGFRRLQDELKRIKPTMIIVCFGANASTDNFEKEFADLFIELQKHADRFIVMSHPAAENLGAEFASVVKANSTREKASEILRQFVKSKNNPNIQFVDLFHISQQMMSQNAARDRQPNGKAQFTSDTIRFTANGYERLSRAIAKQLGWIGSEKSSTSTRELRDLLATKNELYFHRYRPQNETYLRGFRKHEQGQNAKEIAQFDELIDLAERRVYAFANGQPLPQPIAKPDPIKLSFTAATTEEELKTFRIAEGLEVNLFASEPMVANPIHMNFDAEGRLWVATSPIYPQIKPGAEPKDEIVVLEDTDGDGRADKKTVFADDLLIPTAVLPDERGGVYVANSTELLHLQDTDGDGKADQRRVVLAGFGTEDTHHILHTFRYGPDATIYFNQSIYIHTHMETPQGVRRLMGSGIWRFEPQTVSASILMRGLVNPWGHIFDDWGQSFATDGAGGDGINYAFPGSAYPTAVGYRKVMRGLNPGQPKLCGLEIITGQHFPAPWQNTLVANDFRGNRINRFQLSPQSSGYVSKQLPDLLSSSHRAFRPVDLKMAPDGSLMIADWYNPIINHGEVDFRDSRRDYKHGRIWRVTVKGQPPIKRPDFKNASYPDLVKMMTLPERWSRINARVELKNRIGRSNEKYQKHLAKPLQKLLNSSNPEELLAGLWTLAAVAQFDFAHLEKALASSDYRLRAAALRIINDSGNFDPKIESAIIASLSDPHPQVRLEALSTWHQTCDPQSIDAVLGIIDQPLDKNLEFLLGQVLRESKSSWANDLANGNLKLDSNKLFFLLKQAGINQAVVPILRQLREGKLEPELLNEAINLIGQYANQNQLKSLFQFGLSSPSQPQVLAALANASKSRKLSLPLGAAELSQLLNNPNGIRLAGLGKVNDLKSKVVSIAMGSENNKVELRRAAIEALGSYSDIDTLSNLGRDTKQPARVRRLAISELASQRLGLGTEIAAEFIQSVKTQIQQDEAVKLAEAFLQRRNGAKKLAESLTKVKITSQLAELIAAKANRFGADGKLLAQAVRSQTKPAKTIRTPKDVDRFVKLVAEKGNATRGEAIYRRPKLNCIKCHAIGGAGGVVGPDMISLGASSPVDYIVQSLIDPNAKIKEGYHTTIVLTEDGQQVSGKLMSQADGKVILRDADDVEHVFDEDNIEGQKISPVSLMPTDSTNSLSDADFIDLATFLSELGKEGQFKISSEPFVRRWITETNAPIFSRVDGSLPMNELAGQIASFEIDVTQAGSIGVHIENPGGLRITLNDMKDNLRAQQIVKNLPQGTHRFTFQIMNKGKRESLRVKLFDVPDSTGRATVINQ